VVWHLRTTRDYRWSEASIFCSTFLARTDWAGLGAPHQEAAGKFPLLAHSSVHIHSTFSYYIKHVDNRRGRSPSGELAKIRRKVAWKPGSKWIKDRCKVRPAIRSGQWTVMELIEQQRGQGQGLGLLLQFLCVASESGEHDWRYREDWDISQGDTGKCGGRFWRQQQ
jgi:hypothetical protein